MGDMGDDFRAMRDEKKRRHREWREENREAIVSSGLPFIDRGEAFLFRDSSKTLVDFYPSTGRWRVLGAKGTQSGGAEKFLEWYGQR